MSWESKTCFDVTLTTRHVRGTCDKVEVVDGGALRIENDHNGAITHLFAARWWVACDVWTEATT